MVGNIDRLFALVRRKGPPSFVSATMSVMKANVLDIPNLVEFARAAGDHLWAFARRLDARGPEPHVLQRPGGRNRRLARGDRARPKRDSRGSRWKSRAACRAPHTHFDVLNETIPWAILDRPHFSVEGFVPERLARNCRRQFGEEVLVGFFPAAGRRLDECRYYAPLEDRRYRVALPEGEYALGFFPRNRYASPLPSYRIRVVRENGEARLETIRLPLRVASAVKAVRTALSRFLPDSSKRILKRLVARP